MAQAGNPAHPLSKRNSPRFALGWQELSRAESERRHANPADGSRFCEINGARVHFRDEGQGRVLLLLHGICDSLHTWNPWAEELRNSYRVVRLDLPGFGLSTLPDRGIDAELYNNTLAGLLSHLEINGPLVVVGNSLGGYVASSFASAFPDRVTHLVLLAPGGFPMARYPWPIEVANVPVLRAVAQRFTPKHVILKTVSILFGDKSAIRDEMVDRWLDLTRTEGNRKSYFRIFRFIKRFEHEYPYHLAKIRCKTMLMWGTHDPWLPLEHAGLWQKEIPQTVVKLYPHCGHMPQLEIPHRSSLDLRTFIEN